MDWYVFQENEIDIGKKVYKDTGKMYWNRYHVL